MEKSVSKELLKKDAEIDRLKRHLEQTTKKLAKYKKTIEMYDIEIEEVSDVEYICIQEIAKLKQVSDMGILDDVEVKNLDTLHKNLRQVRNNKDAKKAKKREEEKSLDNLLQIVEKQDKASE